MPSYLLAPAILPICIVMLLVPSILRAYTFVTAATHPHLEEIAEVLHEMEDAAHTRHLLVQSLTKMAEEAKVDTSDKLQLAMWSFGLLDSDSNGYITLKEMMNGFNQAGLHLTRKGARRLMRAWEQSHDEQISLFEFAESIWEVKISQKAEAGTEKSTLSIGARRRVKGPTPSLASQSPQSQASQLGTQMTHV